MNPSLLTDMPRRWRNLMAVENDVRYGVNARDDLVFVDDQWNVFTKANPTPDVLGESVIGQSLWDYIVGDRLSELYRRILARVRQGRDLQFQFYSDGPAIRRHLELEVVRDGKLVVFTMKLVRTEPRDPRAVRQHDLSRPDERVRICSWCNRVDAGGNQWVDLEDALGRLRLIDFNDPPQLNHGICRACFDDTSESLIRP